MRQTVSLCLTVALLRVVVPHATAADAQPTATVVANETRGKTTQSKSYPSDWDTLGIPYGWYHLEQEGEVHVVYDPKTPDALEFRIVREGVPVISLRGHRWSACVAGQDTLFFADYQPTDPGGAVEAYNLADGKRLWRTELSAVGPFLKDIDDSAEYANRVGLYYSPRFRGGFVRIVAHETPAEYQEVLDANTGQRTAHLVYDHRVNVMPHIGAPGRREIAADTNETDKKTTHKKSFPSNWDTSGIRYGWYHVKQQGELHVVYDPKMPDVLEFRFVCEEVPIISLRGHRWSSFTSWENILLFADYQPTVPGCAVEGYSLEDGKRLWRTEVTIAGPGSPKSDVGKDYYTRAALRFMKGTLELVVEETAGRYKEILDPKTGKSLERRVFNKRGTTR